MQTRLALTALAIGLAVAPACAQPQRVDLGTLTCTAIEVERDQSVGGEAVNVSCQFRGRESSYAETYTGALMRSGSQSVNGPTVLMWTVSGEAGELSPGILEQTYRARATGDPDSRKLQGQTNAAIELRPFAKVDQATEQTITVLDLSLKRTSG